MQVQSIQPDRQATREDASRRWKFADILAQDEVRRRWQKVRRWFFLRESTYDMTRRCNIRCEGCYYYQGEKQAVRDNSDAQAWRLLMQAEKQRGITYVVLAGAEPSLAPELCRVCHEEIPLGTIATNGLVRIPRAIDYRVHISVWGNDATSLRLRRAADMLERQIDLYAGDPRAIFVYTFTRDNIDEAEQVAARLARNHCELTFNVFSAPVDYHGELRHTPESLRQMRQAMQRLMHSYAPIVRFSPYNALVHSRSEGLHALFTCPYPRRNPSASMGLGRSFRQYRSDLSWQRRTACCVPDTACEDCRHYAAGSAIVTARMFRHASHPQHFRAWLDYVDTYLAVWIRGYAADPPLAPDPVAPPVSGGKGVAA